MTWVKGQSGNPKGRKPSGMTRADLFRAEGQQPHILIDKNGKAETTTRLQALIRVAYDRAIAGDDAYARICLDSVYGKVMDQLQLLAPEEEWDLTGLSEKELNFLAVIIPKIRKASDAPSDAE